MGGEVSSPTMEVQKICKMELLYLEAWRGQFPRLQFHCRDTWSGKLNVHICPTWLRERGNCPSQTCSIRGGAGEVSRPPISLYYAVAREDTLLRPVRGQRSFPAPVWARDAQQHPEFFHRVVARILIGIIRYIQLSRQPPWKSVQFNGRTFLAISLIPYVKYLSTVVIVNIFVRIFDALTLTFAEVPSYTSRNRFELPKNHQEWNLLPQGLAKWILQLQKELPEYIGSTTSQVIIIPPTK